MSRLTEILEQPIEELTPQEWLDQLRLFRDPEAMRELFVEHLLTEIISLEDVYAGIVNQDFENAE